MTCATCATCTHLLRTEKPFKGSNFYAGRDLNGICFGHLLERGEYVFVALTDGANCKLYAKETEGEEAA